MINLLPPEEIKARIGSYHARRRVVYGGAILGWVVVAVILTGVVYARLHFNQVAVPPLPEITQASADLAALPKRLDRLSTDLVRQTAFLELLSKTLSHRNQAVRITDIRYAEGDKTLQIELAGFALSRQSLLQFLEEFKNDPTFSVIDSPISNLIKERDVPFTLLLSAPAP